MTPRTQKNPEIPKNFDPVFNHEGVPKIDFCGNFVHIQKRLNCLNIQSDFR